MFWKNVQSTFVLLVLLPNFQIPDYFLSFVFFFIESAVIVALDVNKDIQRVCCFLAVISQIHFILKCMHTAGH